MMITKIIEKLFYRFRKRRTNGVKKVACWLLLSWFLKIFRLLFYSIVYQCEITVHWLCFALHLSLSRQLKWNSRVLLPAVQVACLSLFHVEEFSISFKYVRCCPCQPAQKNHLQSFCRMKWKFDWGWLVNENRSDQGLHNIFLMECF